MPAERRPMQWLEPWCALTEVDTECARALERVLGREMASGHPLYDLPVKAVARRGDNDDVLFELLDGTGRVAVVHPTWTQSPPERLPWPLTEMYASLDAFSAERMTSDHQDVQE